MKVLVLGSGVVGTTSAYYLARAGHEVVVVDRAAGPALATSFANAGQVSPGYSAPWAAPGIPMKAIKWLAMKHAPLILKPGFDLRLWGWLARMLANCTEQAYALNKGRMVRLAEYSRDVLMALREDTGIAYDQRMQGTLQLFRTQKQMDGIGKDVAVLKASGVPYEVLDRAGCIAIEPGLAHMAEPFVGGLRLPGDETGDCFKFTNALADIAQGQGVSFRQNVDILGLESEGGRITGVRTSVGLLTADAYLVAAGSWSPALVGPLGIDLPVCPVKGYSLTIPITQADRAPVSTVMDETFKIAITRLGDRIRVGGMAEISGFSTDLPAARRATLEMSVSSLFPGAGDLAQASFWSGLRPMTPDGTPVIGATGYGNLFLNTGHGTLGWTMACGSGQVIADIISGRPTAIESTDLAMARYAR